MNFPVELQDPQDRETDDPVDPNGELLPIETYSAKDQEMNQELTANRELVDESNANEPGGEYLPFEDLEDDSDQSAFRR